MAAVARSVDPSMVWVLNSSTETPVDAPPCRGGQTEELRVTWPEEEGCVKRLKMD